MTVFFSSDESRARTGRFANIFAARQIEAAVDLAIEFRTVVRITGPSGVGKTCALKRLAELKKGLYCSVSQMHTTPSGMYQMLVVALDAYPRRENLQMSNLVPVVQSYFMGTCKPVFVDEYQTLHLTAQRELLHLQEQCCFPLVLSGNGQSLAKRTTDRATLAQITSRYAMDIRIEGPSAEDCRAIGVEFNVEGADAYQAISAYGQRTNLRQLVWLLNFAESAAGRCGSIKLHHIETVARGQGHLELLKPKKEKD